MLKQVCFIFSLVTVMVAHAQPLPLETYTPESGLADARVSKMFQDSKGRLYFLTREGFSIFDGQHFDNYGTEITYGTGIISDIAEYENGIVKIFSYDGDIYTLNNNRVVKDTSQRGLLKEISKIHSISNNDKLVLTNYHLFRQKTNTFQTLAIGSVKPGFIDYSVLFGEYLLLVQSDENKSQELFLYNYTTQKIADSIKIYSPLSFINKVGNNILMTNAAGHWFSIDSVLLQQGRLQLQPYHIAGLMPGNFTPYKIQTSNTGQAIWFIDGEKGYCKVNLATHTKDYFKISDGILSTAGWVFEDAEKNFWFGSTAMGVQKLQYSSLVKLDKINNSPLGSVLAINKTAINESFINTTSGIFINEKKISPPFKDNSSFVFWQNQYWQFKDYKTLYGSRGKTFQLDKLIPGYSTEDFLFSHSTIDKEGRLVISGRIFIFIDPSFHFSFFRPGYFCDNIVETAVNQYWCFLRSNEIIKLQWNNDTLKRTYSKNFPNLAPRFTIQWDSSTFLTGTRLSGIKIFKWLNNELQLTGTISKLNGLSNNFINVLLKKDNRHLLAGTGKGLDAITLSEQDTIVENISQRNNIYVPFDDLIQQYDAAVLCRTLDGQLFKLTHNTGPISDFLPNAFFKTITVSNEIIDIDSQCSFKYSSNDFVFSVSTPSFFDNKKILFQFMLQGNGQHWQQNTNSSGFEIKNLLPGNYTLTVNILYPGKIYPNKQLTYHFTIDPPFWKRWWFILLTIIFSAALIVYTVQQFYRRRLQKQIAGLEKQQAVEKERTRIATDMHDDFGANLSRIKFISEKIQVLHQKDDSLKNDLVKISAYSDEMAEKMNEIVWALNQRYDSLDDLVSFSRAYAADYLQDKNIKLVFIAGNSINKKIHGEVRRNIFMVIKEALHNIIKHAGASTVTIEFKTLGYLSVNIKDDGKGIDTGNIRPFANGLDNMKKRMESIGGQIAIYKDNGTVIMIQVPI